METLLVEKKDKVAKVTINRPEQRNALDYETHLKLISLFRGFEDDEEVDLVILTGAGRAFCAGADVSIFKMITDARRAMRRIDHVEELARAIEELSKPVIARVNGPALGLGFLLVMASDFAIASEDSILGWPVISVGIAGGAARLAHILGEKKLKELILLGKVIGAKEAEALGLVTRAVPPEELDAEVEKVISELRKKSPIALRLTKRAINAAYRERESGGLLFDTAIQTISLLTEDVREGVEAFLEKREPRWKGR